MWGGRRLGTVLGKPIGDGDHYAESWEIVDHGADQSVVADGPLAGTTLHELVTQHGPELFGRHHPQPQFPLLFKFLDCQLTLSVQVHPNDAQARKLTPPDLGKTEAWVVLAAEPGSKIYAGLKPGVDRASSNASSPPARATHCLHQLEPRVGDCMFIEAGTVHALGAGLVIAEIQQASNTTFRLFDWNRLDRDGKPRPLHIEESLDTIDYAPRPRRAASPAADRSPARRAARRLRQVRARSLAASTRRRNCGGDNRCHIVWPSSKATYCVIAANVLSRRNRSSSRRLHRRVIEPQGRAVLARHVPAVTESEVAEISPPTRLGRICGVSYNPRPRTCDPRPTSFDSFDGVGVPPCSPASSAARSDMPPTVRVLARPVISGTMRCNSIPIRSTTLRPPVAGGRPHGIRSADPRSQTGPGIHAQATDTCSRSPSPHSRPRRHRSITTPPPTVSPFSPAGGRPYQQRRRINNRCRPCCRRRLRLVRPTSAPKRAQRRPLIVSGRLAAGCVGRL